MFSIHFYGDSADPDPQLYHVILQCKSAIERGKDKEVFLGLYILHIVQYICVFHLTAEEQGNAKSKKSAHVRKQVCIYSTWKMHEDQYSSL